MSIGTYLDEMLLLRVSGLVKVLAWDPLFKKMWSTGPQGHGFKQSELQ